MNIVSDDIAAVLEKLNTKIETSGNQMTSIIKGQDELWDVSIMKFIYEITRHSIQGNVSQFSAHGLLSMDKRGVPAEARVRIEQMFTKAESGEIEPRKLKEEIDNWSLFDEYEDRFFRLFKKH